MRITRKERQVMSMRRRHMILVEKPPPYKGDSPFKEKDEMDYGNCQRKLAVCDSLSTVRPAGKYDSDPKGDCGRNFDSRVYRFI